MWLSVSHSSAFVGYMI